jgi:D-alanyl-D-alanine carboxypeptidase/D-alanyl-D-alanine-endopeptidase (penicillin-binding protein 4)
MPMSRPRRPLLAAVASCAVLLGGASPADAITARTLQSKLTTQTAKLGPASGAYVVDLDTGTELFSRRPDLALSPASNEKLFTTATALLRFGPRATLRTVAAVPEGATIDAAGVLRGDLYLVGGGDPSLNDVALKALAAELADVRGLRRVTGGVRGDESVFDRRRGSYDSGFGPDDDLGGWLGGLTWGHGRAYPDGPAAVAAARLHRFLKAEGIRLGRRPRAAEAPLGDRRTVLGSISSPPMSTLIATTNQPSDNFYAETLVKALAVRFGSGTGTTAGGLRIVRDQLARTFGIRPTVVDGSGLSRSVKATPRQIVALLKRMRTVKDSAVFVASLAVPGRIGTLAGRMRGTRADGACQAKTGTLRGVSALSGYCRADNGHTIAFSFIENAMDASAAKSVEDRMVPQLVRYTG